MKCTYFMFYLVASLAAGGFVGCADTGGAPAAEAEATFRPLGYMMLADSNLAVIDMLEMKRIDKFKVGHAAVHQVAVLPDNRTVYTGNIDDGTILKLKFSEDGRTHTTTVVGKSPVNMHFFESAPDGKHVVITSRMELDAAMTLPNLSALPDDSIAILDTATDKVVKVVALQSPAMPAFANDGRYLYVNNTHHGTISVLDTATWTEIQRVSVLDKPLPAAANGRARVSPDGLDVSPDGKWVISADYEARTITVHEVGADGKLGQARKVRYEGSAMPHDARFTTDSSKIWVTDYDRVPDPADEVANAKMITHVKVYDVVTLEVLNAFTLSRPVQRISLPQYSKWAYLTTGLGGLLAVDRDTGALQAEAMAGTLGNPVVCGMASY